MFLIQPRIQHKQQLSGCRGLFGEKIKKKCTREQIPNQSRNTEKNQNARLSAGRPPGSTAPVSINQTSHELGIKLECFPAALIHTCSFSCSCVRGAYWGETSGKWPVMIPSQQIPQVGD